ncbi:hypothetical protein ACOMHN_067744 [Nucella lapillus]
MTERKTAKAPTRPGPTVTTNSQSSNQTWTHSYNKQPYRRNYSTNDEYVTTLDGRGTQWPFPESKSSYHPSRKTEQDPDSSNDLTTRQTTIITMKKGAIVHWMIKIGEKNGLTTRGQQETTITTDEVLILTTDFADGFVLS